MVSTRTCPDHGIRKRKQSSYTDDLMNHPILVFGIGLWALVPVVDILTRKRVWHGWVRLTQSRLSIRLRKSTITSDSPCSKAHVDRKRQGQEASLLQLSSVKILYVRHEFADVFTNAHPTSSVFLAIRWERSIVHVVVHGLVEGKGKERANVLGGTRGPEAICDFAMLSMSHGLNES